MKEEEEEKKNQATKQCISSREGGVKTNHAMCKRTLKARADDFRSVIIIHTLYHCNIQNEKENKSLEREKKRSNMWKD